MKLIVQGTPGKQLFQPSNQCISILVDWCIYRSRMFSRPSPSAGNLHHPRRHPIRTSSLNSIITIRSPQRRSDHILTYLTMATERNTAYHRTVSNIISRRATAGDHCGIVPGIRISSICNGVWHDIATSLTIRHYCCRHLVR